MLYGCQKSIQCLPRKSTSCNIRNSNRKHKRNLTPYLLHCRFRSINGRFGIQGIENGFYQKRIHSSFQQSFHLFLIGSGQFIVCQSTQGRIIDIRTHGTSFVGRTYRTCYKSRFMRGLRGIFVSHFASKSGSGQINLTAQILHMIICHRNPLGIERICFNNINPCFQIFMVDILYHIRAGKTKQVIIALHLSGHLSKTLSPEILFRQIIPLYHSSHCTIKNENSLVN